MSKSNTMESAQLTDAMYYILLSLMIERHGYAIMKYIEELSNQSITMGPGTLYTLLKKLCRAEWILQTSVTADRTKKYQITDTGRQVLLHEVARRKRMVEDGHTVGNHTYHHYDMSKISDSAVFRKEMDDVRTLFQETTGTEMAMYYRPPQGKYSETNLQMAKDLGYSTFFWSLAYVDWIQDQQPSREEAFQKLLGRIHPGAIVLLHNTSSTNGLILDDLLTKWEEMGYRFCSLKELTGA